MIGCLLCTPLLWRTVYRRAEVLQFSQVFVGRTGARANTIEDLLSQPLQYLRLLRKHIQHESESRGGLRTGDVGKRPNQGVV